MHSAWKWTIAGTALALCVAAAPKATPKAEPVRSNDPADIAAIIAFEKSAAQATDLDSVVNLFAVDAVVADLSAPGWMAGQPAIREALRPQYEAVKAIRPGFKSVDVASNGRYACAAMYVDLDGEFRNGTPLKTSFRELDVFRKDGDRWTWIQQQVSYPIDRETGRSLLHAQWPARQGLANGGPVFTAPRVGVQKAKAELSAWLQSRATATTIDKLLSHYDAEGGLIVYGTHLPAENRGIDEVRAYYAPRVAQAASIAATVKALRIDTDGSFGAMVGQLKLDVAEKDGGSHSRLYRYSACLRRTPAGWRAFAEMMSAPVNLTTGMPVTSTAEMERLQAAGH